MTVSRLAMWSFWIVTTYELHFIDFHDLFITFYENYIGMFSLNILPNNDKIKKKHWQLYDYTYWLIFTLSGESKNCFILYLMFKYQRNSNLLCKMWFSITFVICFWLEKKQFKKKCYGKICHLEQFIRKILHF